MGYILRYIAARLAFQAVRRIFTIRGLTAVGAVVVLVAFVLSPYWRG